MPIVFILIVFMAVLRVFNVFNADYIIIPLSGLQESFWCGSLEILLINAMTCNNIYVCILATMAL